MAGIRVGRLNTKDVAHELEVSRRQIQKLYGTYLKACAEKKEHRWAPGHSGGYHGEAYPEEVLHLWRKLLGSKPPLSYSFTASETFRCCKVRIDRATVRRWALNHGFAPPKESSREPASVRRWQSDSVGALWQLDVSPHSWFVGQEERLPLFDMLDDCSRVVVGSRLYPRECLLAYLDFLRRCFEAYGLPTTLYVDFHSFFFTALPDALTYLGEVLQWLGITFKYAPTPQAKGKIERQHLFWQNRLPAFFAANQIATIDQANPQIDQLRTHHNDFEIHRELDRTPTSAWKTATREKRSVLRKRPITPWWTYLWTVRTTVKVGIEGTVLLGPTRVKVPHRPGTRFTHCRHPDGSFTLLANIFGKGKPIVLHRLEGSKPQWIV